MKSLMLFLTVLVAVALVQGQGIPIAKCPAGEHSVFLCPQKAEPSCDNQTVHEMNPPSGLCGVPQCFCNTPNVRNIKTGKCVKISQCKP